MEYKESPDLDDAAFDQMDAQQYMSVDNCCGGEEYFVCVVTSKNDALNEDHSDMVIKTKSEQCKACYWFNTAVHILVQAKQLKNTNHQINELLNNLPDNLDLFLVPP